MKRKLNIVIGQKFSRWTVVAPAPSNKRYRRQWHCKCECGAVRIVLENSLTCLKSKSCGCLHKELSSELACRLGKLRKGSKNPRWKGGRIINAEGYIYETCPGHPRVRKGSNYVLEHILVMEKRLGRYLYPHETVHHINGNRSDNRDENLELWASNHPPGQRVEDLVIYAKEILSLYG